MPLIDQKPDIRVKLRFLTTEEGGRQGPVMSGYRPQFFYNNHHWDAVHSYPTDDWLPLGSESVAELHFLSPEQHVGKIYVGMPFGLYEGNKKVGRHHHGNLIFRRKRSKATS